MFLEGVLVNHAASCHTDHTRPTPGQEMAHTHPSIFTYMLLEGILVNQPLATLITLGHPQVKKWLALHLGCLPGIDPGTLPATQVKNKKQKKYFYTGCFSLV